MVKSEKIKNILKVVLPKESFIASLKIIIDKLSTISPELSEIPSKAWDDFDGVFDENELYRRLEPVYVEHFKDKEIDELYELCQNDTFLKFLEISSMETNVHADITKVCETYSNEIMTAIMMKVNSGGYDDDII